MPSEPRLHPGVPAGVPDARAAVKERGRDFGESNIFLSGKSIEAMSFKFVFLTKLARSATTDVRVSSSPQRGGSSSRSWERGYVGNNAMGRIWRVFLFVLGLRPVQIHGGQIVRRGQGGGDADGVHFQGGGEGSGAGLIELIEPKTLGFAEKYLFLSFFPQDFSESERPDAEAALWGLANYVAMHNGDDLGAWVCQG